MISRFLEKPIIKALKPGKVVVLLGARRTGKTVLMSQICQKIKGKVLMVQGDNLDVAEILSSQRVSLLKRLVEGYNYLFVDEAHKIPNIGLNLKLLADCFPTLSVFVSGSSSFNLKNKIGEPLVGRSYYFHLHPISLLELKNQENYLESRENLENRLIFGLYPEVFTAETIEEKRKQLEAIRDGYLLQDILALDNLKNSLFVFNLLRLLAFQIGNDISYSELASSLNVNKKTVMRYLELLEKTFVIFSLPGFSRNLRKEYTKTPRYYFWDNGIRNTIISNYNFLNSRDDVGRLWENFCLVERIKKTTYQNLFANRFFWRTYDQKEIDYLEEKEGKLFAYEFKWGKDKVKQPKEFLKTYQNSKFQIINQENFWDFVS
jgi:hypothetical protein